MQRIGLLFLICGLVSTGMAADHELESQLTGQYQAKVLALRHAFKSNSQDYMADGTPITAGQEGPWTLYGRMIVKKIKVDRDHLKVEGKRAVYFFDKSGNLAQFPEDRKHPAGNVAVILRLQQPLSSADEAATILGRVFAQTPEEMLNSVPPYWQPCLATKLTGKPTNDDARDSVKDQPQLLRRIERGNAGGEEVFKIGEVSVSAPHALRTPEPEFTDAARARRFQGVVGLNVIIDSTGTVRNIKIVKPLGMGLDDNAVATVSTWRFAPGTKDGRPIAVALFIEVDFHLY